MKFPGSPSAMIAPAALAVSALIVVSSAGAAASIQGNAQSSSWVASWAAAVTAGEPTGPSHTGFDNQSYRMGVHISIGGDKLRVRLTNIYGTQTVTIGHATVAKPDKGTQQAQDIDLSTLRELTFNGKPTTTILQGDELYSDPVDLSVDNGSDLVVTLYFPNPTGPTTWHASSRQRNFAGPGDLADSNDGWTLARDCCWFFLSGVDVLSRRPDGAIAVLGDSISDGNGATLDANTRWPDLLAKRLLTTANAMQTGVVNVSLAGNRLNHEGPEPGAGGFPGFVQLGPNAGARLNEDAFPQAGVRTVIIQLGVDDIWMNGDSADAITDSLQKIAIQLQQRGLKVIVSTIMPFHGFEQSLDGAWTPEKETVRNAVNSFIRNNPDFDVVDFDALLSDPADPTKLRAEIDSGDHLHPNDLGARRMADFVPLALLR